jgi:hypothetical protein
MKTITAFFQNKNQFFDNLEKEQKAKQYERDAERAEFHRQYEEQRTRNEPYFEIIIEDDKKIREILNFSDKQIKNLDDSHTHIVLTNLNYKLIIQTQIIDTWRNLFFICPMTVRDIHNITGGCSDGDFIYNSQGTSSFILTQNQTLKDKIFKELSLGNYYFKS